MAMTDNNPENRINDAVDDTVDAAFVPSADSANEPNDAAEDPAATESAELEDSTSMRQADDEDNATESPDTPVSEQPADDEAVADPVPNQESDEVNDADMGEPASGESAQEPDDTSLSVTESASAQSPAINDDADGDSDEEPGDFAEPRGEVDAQPELESDDADTSQTEGLTYTTAIQRITSAMASGQLIQKVRARLVKHSHDIAQEREDLLPPPPPLPQDETEETDATIGASASTPESTEDPLSEMDAPVAATGDEPDEEVDEQIESVLGEPAEETEDESASVAISPAQIDPTSAETPLDIEETQVEPATDETRIIPPPLPAEPSMPEAPSDLPPLKPVASVEPKRIKITRSGNKILALPAGTQVLKNSLRSVRTTIDTLNSGGRIDPTRPTIAIFAVGMVVASILSIATLKGTFDFGHEAFTSDITPTPTVSSPEPIPDESPDTEEDTAAETQEPKPVIQEIKVISYNDDGGDHQELADLMTDDDASTNWQSRYFATADLPEDNTVRLVITLAEAVPVSEVIFTGAISGGQVDLRINDGSDPFGGAALTSSEMSQTTTLKPSEPVTGNTVTLNFVSLPTDDEGVNRVKITELQIR